jgi:hypothetical protein
MVQLGPSKHEVGTRRADLRAVLEEPDVLGRGVFPAQLQAVSGGLHTDRVAVDSIVDTLLHIAAQGLHGHRGHRMHLTTTWWKLTSRRWTPTEGDGRASVRGADRPRGSRPGLVHALAAIAKAEAVHRARRLRAFVSRTLT